MISLFVRSGNYVFFARERCSVSARNLFDFSRLRALDFSSFFVFLGMVFVLFAGVDLILHQNAHAQITERNLIEPVIRKIAPLLHVAKWYMYGIAFVLFLCWAVPTMGGRPQWAKAGYLFLGMGILVMSGLIIQFFIPDVGGSNDYGAGDVIRDLTKQRRGSGATDFGN